MNKLFRIAVFVFTPTFAVTAQTNNPGAQGQPNQGNGRFQRGGPQGGQRGGQQGPGGQRGGAGPMDRFANVTAPSHVYKRGDVEILTFETEHDYDLLQDLYKKSEEAKPAPGETVTRYYRSDTDGSVQPYTVRLPRGYDPAKKYPVVVQLHGTNFHEVLSGYRTTYHMIQDSQWTEPDLQVIYLRSMGGPTTFYQGMGEVDVLKGISEMKRLFSVDPDRVYIMGHSMGGAGSYTVGLHYPDRFGGIMAFDPAMGGHAAQIPDDLPKWMLPQVAIVSPPKLFPNGRNVDVFFKNAGAGIQRNSTEFADGIVAQGGFATTEVLPGMPHSFGGMYPNAAWVTEVILHPAKHDPAEVKFYTNTLQYNQAYWVTIDRLTHHNADATVTATYKDGSLHVTTSNIDALTFRTKDIPAPKGSKIAVSVDGHAVETGTLSDVAHLSKAGGQWKAGEWPSTGLVKRHGLQGPIGDAFNSRFLAVYGEGDRDLAIAELDAIRNPQGPFDIHGDFPMKAAAKVTREDIASSNLILFGTPESNAVVKRIAASLPSGMAQPGTIFIYPNPESPAHYVVVWNAKLLSAPGKGLFGGWIMPLNLLPDYVQVKDGQVLSGGFFDNEWKTGR
jgi:pimeloyl-ACP methyl ester carboxylesterase